MTLLALYVGALLFGGILLGASVIGGGQEHEGQDGGLSHDHGEAGHDADHGDGAHDGAHDLAVHADAAHADAAHDHGAHEHTGLAKAAEGASAGGAGLLLSTLRSIRLYTFGAGAFGLSGVLLTLLGVGAGLTLGVASALGLVIGFSAATLLRHLAADTRNTDVGTGNLRGREGEVVLSIGPEKRGKVRLQHNGQWIELAAVTSEAHTLERGARVLLVEVREGVANVTGASPRPPPVLKTPSHH